MGCGGSKATADTGDERLSGSPVDKELATKPRSPNHATLGLGQKLEDGLNVHVNKHTDKKVTPASEKLHRGAALPTNEEERWGFLCSLNVLDTEPEPRFDDITKLCCMIFKVPIALVSLVDKDRQWFNLGGHFLMTFRTLLPNFPEVLVVEDATKDPRFQHNPLVMGHPSIRFYAGTPLVGSNGLRMGSLCIIDTLPRPFDAESCNVLANMGEMVVREIEKEQLLRDHKQRTVMLSKEHHQLLRAIDCFTEGIMLCNMSVASWPILFVNESWEKMTGISRTEGCGRSLWSLFQMQGAGPSVSSLRASQEDYMQVVRQQENFQLQGFFTAGDCSRRWMTMEFRCASNTTLSSNMPAIGVPNFLESSAEGPGPIYYFATLKDSRPEEMSPRALTVVPVHVAFQDLKLGPLLGKGAYGRVYRGLWNGAQVAVKVIEHPDVLSEEGPTLEALLHEEVCHPNIVQTYRYLTRPLPSSGACSSGRPMMETWLVLEYCNKGCISDAIDRGWFRNPEDMFESNLWSVLITGKEISGAMSFLHSRNILHGDLTSNNILLTSSDKDARNFIVKVSDFGLSRVLTTDIESIQTMTYGTVTHMPPELLVDGTLSRAADVYAFGVVLWEMYHGHHAFQGLSPSQVIHSVSSGKSLEFGSSTPLGFQALVNCCLARSPSDRPTFAQLLGKITELQEEVFGTTN